MLDLLRDPVWQFIGVVLALATCCVPIIWKKIRMRTTYRIDNKKDMIPNSHGLISIDASAKYYPKHKKLKSDGILLGNISSDYLNQFPVSIKEMAAHLDMIYTPENFGGKNWLDVFKRFIKDGYFISENKLLNITAVRLTTRPTSKHVDING